ncbi:MAG: DUF58 domain-containing protein, partial [Gammaproteobacteria bacterium]|nr:DUF58 domain-containing protein [Gammaproteobacteria bacterium]
MAQELSFEELFDTEFLSALEAFTLRAKRVPQGGFFANQNSPSRGSGLEFQDFKAYVPGDDIRAIDLNIYQRLGKLFIRIFEEQRNLPIYLLVDQSASMYLEDSSRIIAGLRSALALTSLSLSQHDSVALYSFTDQLHTLTRSRTGKHNLIPIARLMSELYQGTTTDLSDSLAEFGQYKLRRGLLVVISDFFDPMVFEDFARRLRLVKHRSILIQLVKDSDGDPTLQAELNGDVRLLDCETNIGLDISIDPVVLTRYRNAYQDFTRKLANDAAASNSGLLVVNVEQDVLKQLSSMFQYPV